ncbi:MAG: membrane protein insertase YidC [Alphaproteobacteria bacterium]|nr:membrane protein insertase YidC [Alphaproteobacteria bacterium]
MDNNRNFFVAILLCAAVIFGWQYFVAGPQMAKEKAHQTLLAKQKGEEAQTKSSNLPNAAANIAKVMSRSAALREGGQRIVIATPSVNGSLRLKGARFDDLQLRKYRETLDPKSPEIVLFSPESTAFPYYTVFGWAAGPGSKVRVPDDATPWTLASGNVLTPETPITLRWDNGQGLTFTRTISVDKQYMFTIADTVANHGAAAAVLSPYAYVSRSNIPQDTHYMALHEGFVGILGDDLQDPSYSDMKPETREKNFHSTGGWLGLTDKYWMAAIIPPQNQQIDASYRATDPEAKKDFQASYHLGPQTVAPGASVKVTQRLFAGAKVVSVLREYQDRLNIARFDYAVDWGWFFVLTRPMFWLLDYFGTVTGNFGIAILLLTIVVRLIFFPLANTQFKSMSRMKKLQPHVERIRERFADDKMRQQQEMMELYKREKVNPLSGCLPIFIQIPVFFSLYKVLLVSIEMRQAPFFGWIRDLSAPDPTSIWNLFGLFPWHTPGFIPAFLVIGIWPILMGATQWLQTKMNPAPTDPVQAKMFSLMPLIFMFMLASFPAGLVIYWTWSNLLSMIQQYVIMRREGAEIHLFSNLKVPGSIKRLSGPKPGAETGE